MLFFSLYDIKRQEKVFAMPTSCFPSKHHTKRNICAIKQYSNGQVGNLIASTSKQVFYMKLHVCRYVRFRNCHQCKFTVVIIYADNKKKPPLNFNFVSMLTIQISIK